MSHVQATTIVGVRKDGQGALAGDGQVTLGEAVVMKHSAVKVRRLYHGEVLAGFAGSAADSFALFQRFETKLEEYHGQLLRAAVELAKQWRTDRVMQRLEALLLVMDRDHLLVISGSGDVIEPDDGLAAIGSGGAYAMAAGKALLYHSELSAAETAREALRIAAGICVYTNDNITLLELDADA